jgi:iron-sulfur cluster repair protein YtfE (RIC family)
LLWISDKNEKNKAIVELNQLTGHDYKTPKEWSNFWRKKYNNIN